MIENIHNEFENKLSDYKLQSLIESGLSRKAIARKVNVSGDRIQRMIDHYGLSIELRCIPYSDDVIVDVLEYIEKGFKNSEIAQLMDMDHKQISAIRCK